MGASTVAKRKAWAVASLGGVGAMVLGAVFPGAVASGAGPEGRARQPVDPDAAPADDVSTGAFQSCSAYYGWGKSWAHVDVAVDGTIDDGIQYPADYQLVLTGDLDDSTPGTESCVPESLTQADWDTDFPGNARPYSNVTSLPPGSNIVIPGQLLMAAVAGSPLQLTFDGDFPGRTIEVDSASLPNFQDPAAYDAEYVAYLVAAIGQANADAFEECTTSPTAAEIIAANAAFAAMDPAFQDEYLDLAGNTDFTQCFNYNNLRFFFSLYWFPYVWGTENPVTFELASTPAAAPLVIEPTFTG